MLLVAWLGIAMALSALPAYVKIAALAGLVMAAWRDARQAAPALAMTADGRFSLPGQELFGLEAGPRTRTSRWWVHLDLVGPQGRCRLLLLADQLEPGAWRALRLQLKERRHEPRNGRRSRP